MASERFMKQHYGASGYVKLCKRDKCGHPQDWHRHDDEKDDHDPTDPECPFRCLGYDCEVGGPPPKHPCTCPDFVE